MKKLLVILLVMLYGVSSTGATVQLHYCCGKLVSIKFGATPVKDCGSKHLMGSKACCETKAVTASQDQQEVYTVSTGAKLIADPQHFFSEVKPVVQIDLNQLQQVQYSSPHLSKPLFVINCVFRI